VGKKIAFSPGADPELPHFHSRRLKRKKVAGQPLCVFNLFDNCPRKGGCVRGAALFYFLYAPGKIFYNCIFVVTDRKMHADIFLNIHASVFVPEP
jgi:hypothetical protein